MLMASLAAPASVAMTSAVWKIPEPIGAADAEFDKAEVELELLKEELLGGFDELDVVMGDEAAEELV
jgi:hypothetical protein